MLYFREGIRGGMGRSPIHGGEEILDAARDLILEGGLSAASTAAIGKRSGASTGSLYHRFPSRDHLLAELWVRTVRRYQRGLVAAAAQPGEPLEVAMGAAAWTLEFAAGHEVDARFLLVARREELLANPNVSLQLMAELADLNEPLRRVVRGLARRLWGRPSAAELELTSIAVLDLPFTVARRHLLAGTKVGRHRAAALAAVRALLRAGVKGI